MAKNPLSSNVHTQVMHEERQTADSRKSLYEDIEKLLKRPVVSFFTSFVYPVSIDDDDADMLQSVLRSLGPQNLKNGLVVLINSPGGDGLAAERIINVCRSYSQTGDFWTIVAGKAKSAATMICLGSSKIMMAPVSELGPVDPQIIRREDGQHQIFSAHSLVAEYDRLFKGAVQTKGNLQPFIQQLSHFDAREIAKYKSYIDLAEDIAIKSLKSGMMKQMSKTAIKNKIKGFLDPSAGTIAHGRPIYIQEAKSAGINIEELDVKSELWDLIYELYVRADRFVSQNACKTVESKAESFHVPMQS